MFEPPTSDWPAMHSNRERLIRRIRKSVHDSFVVFLILHCGLNNPMSIFIPHLLLHNRLFSASDSIHSNRSSGPGLQRTQDNVRATE